MSVCERVSVHVCPTKFRMPELTFSTLSMGNIEV
jgi:hypothetical protein